MNVSEGFLFLKALERTHEASRRESSKCLESHSVDVESIGLSLKALYSVSTCKQRCRGGDHLFEYLAGRAFNLGYAAFSLIQIGYYDESLNQVRSLGELANLQSLFLTDSKWIEEWRVSSPKERMRRFTPAKVRDLIEGSNGTLLMDRSTYAMLCELSTHVTPNTRPNGHSDDGKPRVGGVQQPIGAALALNHLEILLFCVAIGFCRMTGDDELFDELTVFQEKRKTKE